MVYLAEIILVGPVNITMAWWHSRLIKAGRPIRHGAWAAIFSLLVAVTIWWQWPSLLSWWKAGLFALACACGRLPVFNLALNRFRGLSWTYVSPASTSIIDRITRRLFGSRIWFPEVITGAVFIILQFFI